MKAAERLGPASGACAYGRSAIRPRRHRGRAGRLRRRDPGGPARHESRLRREAGRAGRHLSQRRLHPFEGATAQLREVRGGAGSPEGGGRSEEHTSELQSLMRISYAVFCLKKKQNDYKKRKQT